MRNVNGSKNEVAEASDITFACASINTWPMNEALIMQIQLTE